MNHNETHILIVDDSNTVRNLIKKFLSDTYTIHQASDGDEAWHLIQSNENISLIFSDLHMPVMNGMQLLQHVRSSKLSHISNLPVIIITGHEDNDAAKNASYRMGATDFICKPFNEIDIKTRAASYTKLNKKITTLENNVTIENTSGVLNKLELQRLGDRALASAYRHTHDLSMLVMQAENLPLITKHSGEKASQEIIQGIIKVLSRSLRKEEDLALLDNGRIVIVLPLTRAFKAHIVAMRFKTAIAKTVFQLNNEKFRINLAIGLNSIENHNAQISFDNFKDETERALDDSLRDGGKHVKRYEDVSIKELNTKILTEKTTLTSQQLSENDDSDIMDRDELLLDVETFIHYMPSIIKGEFMDIPSKRLEDMIVTLGIILKKVETKQSTISS